MKKPKHAEGVIRDRRPLGRAIAAGAMAVILASAMSLPAFAADSILVYDAEGNSDTWQEAKSDEALGISWDGADAVTLNNAKLGGLEITGSATVSCVGESETEYITADGDLTLNGDETVPAEQKPILNILESSNVYVEPQATSDEDGPSFDYEGIEATGNLIIKGLTVLFQREVGYISAANVTVDNSKIAVDNTENYIDMYSDGTTDVVESVIDLGTDGGICAQDILTIDNSDITSRATESAFYLDDDIYWAVHSHTGIVLKNEANGEVKKYDGWDEDGIYYVTTGDKDGVFLKAASTPGYYLGTAATKGTKGMPQTGDAVSFGVLAGMAAAAAVAMGISRRRAKNEA